MALDNAMQKYTRKPWKSHHSTGSHTVPLAPCSSTCKQPCYCDPCNNLRKWPLKRGFEWLISLWRSFWKTRDLQELLQIYVQALIPLISHQTNRFVHDFLTYGETKENWGREYTMFLFFQLSLWGPNTKLAQS